MLYLYIFFHKILVHFYTKTKFFGGGGGHCITCMQGYKWFITKSERYYWQKKEVIQDAAIIKNYNLSANLSEFKYIYKIKRFKNYKRRF